MKKNWISIILFLLFFFAGCVQTPSSPVKKTPTLDQYLADIFPDRVSYFSEQGSDIVDRYFAPITSKEINLQEDFRAGKIGLSTHFVPGDQTPVRFFMGTGFVRGKVIGQDLESFFYFCSDPKKECELDFPGVKRLSFQISETNLPFLTGGDQIGIGCSLSGNDIRYVREIINFKDQTYQYKIQTFDSQLTKQVLADLKSWQEATYEVQVAPNGEFSMGDDLVCPNYYFSPAHKIK